MASDGHGPTIWPSQPSVPTLNKRQAEAPSQAASTDQSTRPSSVLHSSSGRRQQTMTAAAAANSDRSPAQAAAAPVGPPELAMVARAVQRLVARNDAVAAPDGNRGGGGLGAFEAARGAPAPRIGVAEYLERVHRYAGLDPECYVVAYAYVDMAAHRRPAAAVASRNVHRLLLACLLVASKVLDDFHHSNAFFARVGGVSNAEMNKLELELLGVLDFAVAVDHRAYGRYREHLEKEMRRDHQGLPKPPRTVAAPAVKPLPRLAEEQPAENVADGGDRDRKPLPNGGVPASMQTSLRELWASDY